jgi:hypothetical protein
LEASRRLYVYCELTMRRREERENDAKHDESGIRHMIV